MKIRPMADRSLVSSDSVEGTRVYDFEGDGIGSIDCLMIDRVSGKVAYAVVSFGGVLTAGHNHYPLPWSALDYDVEADSFRTNVSEQQLQDAPEYGDDSLESRDWEHRVHRHFDVLPYWAFLTQG